MKAPIVVAILLLIHVFARSQGHVHSGGHVISPSHSSSGSSRSSGSSHSVGLGFLFSSGHNGDAVYSPCFELFLASSRVFPGFYERRQFDSIQYWIDKRTRDCRVSADIFALRILLSIEKEQFNPVSLPDTGMLDLLESYSDAAAQLLKPGREDSRIFRLISDWGHDLLIAKTMDSTEKFFCRVFTGEIRHPARYIHQHREQYELLDQKLRQNFLVYRSGTHFTGSFQTGIWIPQGDLSLFGAHPSIGFALGMRSKLNQLDVVLDLRFIRTRNPYLVLREDTLFIRNYYLGGYLGLDYTRYFVHTRRFESGLTVGMGYDGFDIGNSGGNSNGGGDSYLAPLEIGSFNANLGLRLNYFLKQHLYMGMSAKYNFINYCNRGGTSISGNAVSVNFYIGGN